MSQHRYLAQLLAQRRPGYSLPGPFYHDPTVFDADMEEIFHKEWIFVGHTVEIPTRGRYLSVQVGKYPLLIVRGAKGEIHALHNVCRHRGSQICERGKGKVAKLVCPYHQWTFDLDGRLVYTRQMQSDFDAAEHGLLPAHVRTVGGYLFACVAENPPDFDGFAQRLEPFLAPHALENAKVAFESEIIENGNWKLVFENNRECYHCEGSHPELLRSYQDNQAVAGVDQEDPELAQHWNTWEAAGLPSRMVIEDSYQYRMARIPLLKGVESYTMDGRAAVKKPLLEKGGLNIGALLFYHYPTTWNHFMGDHAISFRVEPVNATQTRVITKWLVHKDAEEGRDYDVDNLIRVWSATNDQDRALVEATQVGVMSPAYRPGPYSTVEETGVCQFVDWYCATMETRLAGHSSVAA